MRAVTRIKAEPFAMSIGGEEKKVAPEGPLYSALYEIDALHVLISKEWAQAARRGAGRARFAPTPATGGMRSTRCADGAPAGAYQAASMDALRVGRSMRAISAAGRGGLK